MGVLDEATAHSTCANCIHWRSADAADAIGECRHHSPANIDARGYGQWPQTTRADWCSDHARA